MNQDWEPVILRKASTTAKGARPAGTRPATSTLLDADTPVKLKTLSHETRQTMIQMRAALKLTQVELNQKCGLPAHTIRDIEAGKLTPGQGQLTTINRQLKTNLKLS
jgi:ribosome-binding protein aMBF1 (putative translation factor)